MRQHWLNCGLHVPVLGRTDLYIANLSAVLLSFQIPYTLVNPWEVVVLDYVICQGQSYDEHVRVGIADNLASSARSSL